MPEQPTKIPVEIRPEDNGRVNDPQVAEVMAHAAAPHMEEALAAEKIKQKHETAIDRAFENAQETEDDGYKVRDELDLVEFDAQDAAKHGYDELAHRDKASKKANEAAAQAGYTNEDVGHSSDVDKDQEVAVEMNKFMPDSKKKVNKELNKLGHELGEYRKARDKDFEEKGAHQVPERNDFDIEESISDLKGNYVEGRELAQAAETKVRRVQELREVIENIDVKKIERFIPNFLSRDDFMEQESKQIGINTELDYLEYVLSNENKANITEHKIRSALGAVDFEKDVDELSDAQVREFMNAISSRTHED